MNEHTRERLASLPPSAKLVHYVLVENDRLDQTGVAEESRLSTRTVRFAIEKLSAAGLVEEGVCPTDARRSVYRPVPDPTADVTTGSTERTEADAESRTGTDPATGPEPEPVRAED